MSDLLVLCKITSNYLHDIKKERQNQEDQEMCSRTQNDNLIENEHDPKFSVSYFFFNNQTRSNFPKEPFLSFEIMNIIILWPRIKHHHSERLGKKETARVFTINSRLEGDKRFI